MGEIGETTWFQKTNGLLDLILHSYIVVSVLCISS